ncbi:protein of unknown function (DUF4263) [Parafrankia irregularis]|uniref:Shedu protein SduA C-terminal domain-containing protein n=1 Tax=Parafrankia irregularis TaxID=795642 RepID=A0A0S4QXJ9_9ACTN|nr:MULTISPECIES: Shedu immune nuclease family protein [Parafrankia]MBE3206415.1 DUF4263 domain-containing protein [Parafrankia sp. CH37]CUU60384.1 protein of unknown function (DUF4263) [Parafrankia irregularis]
MASDVDAHFAAQRRPGRLYFTKRFSQEGAEVDPNGQIPLQQRMAFQVHDTSDDVRFVRNGGIEEVLRETRHRRDQLKAVFFEDDRRISQLVFQKFSVNGIPRREKTFSLNGEEVEALKRFLALIASTPMGSTEGSRLDSDLIREVLDSPEIVAQLYSSRKDDITKIIQEDETAVDVIAVRRRRSAVKLFENLLEDADYFRRHQQELGKSRPEDVWQHFFEENRWIFGIGLSAQVFLPWDLGRLSQAVAGASIEGAGKRPDALMRTAGTIGSFVFVEIKRPDTQLVRASTYRSATWPPDSEIVGAVAQCHATVDSAIGRWQSQRRRDSDGYDIGFDVHYCRPRSYLIAGHLGQFVREGSCNNEKFRSFENYRRNLTDPEIITFDELYMRARCAVMDLS